MLPANLAPVAEVPTPTAAKTAAQPGLALTAREKVTALYVAVLKPQPLSVQPTQVPEPSTDSASVCGKWWKKLSKLNGCGTDVAEGWLERLTTNSISWWQSKWGAWKTGSNQPPLPDTAAALEEACNAVLGPALGSRASEGREVE